ncbi:MAG: prepilin-type N-terminal cleavage/methylation domain-containing protein [Gammaproteobacteria bacterium]|nr:prepilin-type N-terminal cleavage/methylation domain-containing protein [Gammaproteobacteria bacterium]MDH5731254.1 prepilin-type N-terminal cleavage/methylation domain-containing protein [Gammaproteobacteria bacterium]
MNIYRRNGFTLIEVLVSVLVFSLGVIGISLHLSHSVKSQIVSDVHRNAMQIASQVVEPLHIELRQGESALRHRLQRLQYRTNPAILTPNASSGLFSFRIAKAFDANGNTLLSTDLDTWKPPYTILLNVIYNNPRGENIQFSTTHVLVP